MRIGEVAAQSGLSVDAVRYYERMGLLAHDARTAGGFRIYPADVLDRLTFIKQAQALGLRLRDIREMLGNHGRGAHHCARVRSLLTTRLAAVDSQMDQLKAFRRTLRSALENCDAALSNSGSDECPVVRSLTPRQRTGARKPLSR